jgi:hypothetical protein
MYLKSQISNPSWQTNTFFFLNVWMLTMFLSAITVGSEKSENKSQISNLKSKLANKHIFFSNVWMLTMFLSPLVRRNRKINLKSQISNPSWQTNTFFFGGPCLYLSISISISNLNQPVNLGKHFSSPLHCLIEVYFLTIYNLGQN